MRRRSSSAGRSRRRTSSSESKVRAKKRLVELAAAAVVRGDTEGAWRREALPQAVLGQLEFQTLCVHPKGPLEVVDRMKGHDETVYCVAAYHSDDGQARLVTVSADGTLRRWNAVTGAVIDVLPGHDYWERCVTSMRLSQDQQVYLVSGGKAGDMRFWRDADGSCVRTVRAHLEG